MESGPTNKQRTVQLFCEHQNPGPRYKLKSLLGHEEHCVSKVREPAFTIKGKRKEPEVLPGPGLYETKPFRDSRGHSFGLKSESLPNLCPAPNAYMISRGIGSKSNLEKNPQTASIRSRTEFGNIYYLFKKAGTPGPGSYSKLDSNGNRNITIKGRISTKNYDTSLDNPAPGSYNVPSFLRGGKGFSIGIRHSPCLMPVKFDSSG